MDDVTSSVGVWDDESPKDGREASCAVNESEERSHRRGAAEEEGDVLAVFS